MSTHARKNDAPAPIVTRDQANMAICRAACELLIRPRSLPMFSKTKVQARAGYPAVTINCWTDIVDAIERFDWREIQELTGERRIEWVKRAAPIQLIGLTERAFRQQFYELFRDEPVADLTGSETKTESEEKTKRAPSVRAVSPRDELEDLAKRPYDDAARAIAGRFIAQNAGKKTAGYGSVQIGGGRLAWRWLETVGRQLEHRRGKMLAVKDTLEHSGLLPGPFSLAAAG